MRNYRHKHFTPIPFRRYKMIRKIDEFEEDEGGVDEEETEEDEDEE
jgi:hypothetical protein